MPDYNNDSQILDSLHVSGQPDRKLSNRWIVLTIGSLLGLALLLLVVFSVLGAFGVLLGNKTTDNQISSDKQKLDREPTGTQPEAPANWQTQAIDSPKLPPSEDLTLSEDTAISIVKSWLEAKQKMNHPPYNRNIAAEIAAGKQYNAAIGTINWLQENNAYYKYDSQIVENLNSLRRVGIDRFEADVTVSETLVLYVNGSEDYNRSGNKVTRVAYTLQYLDGSWKIIDSKILE